ncbi:MAG: zinc-ribbon domain-containing protein [Bacilli bacterium]|nr:zinc-ribbon domain-containing protein [Bacilli bacterium]
MAFCTNCGKEIDSNAYVCIHCGVKTGKSDQPAQVYNNQPAYVSNEGTTLGLVALIVGLFIPIVGWICGGIGLSRANKANNKTGKTLCIIALVTSTLASIYWVAQNPYF